MSRDAPREAHRCLDEFFFHLVQSLKREFCSGGVPFSCRVSNLFPAVVYLYFKERVTAASSAVLGPLGTRPGIGVVEG